MLNLRDGERTQQVTAVVALDSGDIGLFEPGSIVPVRLIGDVDLRVEVDLDRARVEGGMT